MNGLKKISVFILILLTLLASTGFSLEIHFCQGEVESYGIFGASPCQMETQAAAQSDLPPCHQKKSNLLKHKKNGFSSRNCCHNQTFTFNSTADFLNLKSDFSGFNTPVIGPVRVSTTQLIIALNTPREVFFLRYKPPLISADIGVLQQVFRI